jgi:hypothetical protein
MRTIDDVRNQLRAEFLEMPGLHLTAPQVQRLCAVEQKMCQLVLDALVETRFLTLQADGHYARPTEERIVTRPPKKAATRQHALMKAS